MIDTVLFDADGPLCHLFAGYPAAGVAADLRRMLGGDLPASLAGCYDPHRIMRTVNRPDIEAAVTAAELTAAESATLTPGVRELLADLAARGTLLAVTTNNNASAIRRVLALHGITAFGDHVYGRQQITLMKDHPNIVMRAMVELGTEPAHTLLVGDSPSDAVAARRARVEFVGYDARPGAGGALRDAGVGRIIGHMGELVREMDTGKRVAA